MSEAGDLTRILRDVEGGRREAVDRLVPLVYDELRNIAQAHLRGERPDHTLSSTALVHEAWVKLIDIERVDWQDRAHFFAMAARLMRRILIDHARTKGREKRGGDAVVVSLDEASDLPGVDSAGLLDLEDALERLEKLNERQCRVVECRCFVGLSVEETAEALGTSPTTVKRDWAFARAWLNAQLAHDDERDGAGGDD